MTGGSAVSGLRPPVWSGRRRLASWVLECRSLVVEMEQRVDLVSKCQALKVAEEVEV